MLLRARVVLWSATFDAGERDVANFSLIWRESFAHMTDTISDTKLACAAGDDERVES